MIESLYIAATGMHAQQLNVDVIANNLANVNTMGFKKSRVNFEDLMYRAVAGTSGLIGNPDLNNPVGMGAAVSSVAKVFSQGDIKNTERRLDVAISGEGLFEVVLPDGSNAYSRVGSLQLDRDGMLVNGDGYALASMIQLPDDTTDVLIETDGTVMVQVGQSSRLVEVGKLELAKFVNPDGLTPLGDNLYLASQDSGDAFYGDPGEEGFGSLVQGFLEGSNVELVEELTNLIMAQRSYEMSAKLVQAADEMLGIVNNLRR